MTIWYIARGAGLAALILLTLTTALGTLMGGRIPAAPGARVVAQYIHRAIATTALAVLGLHLTMILADSFAHVSLSGALVPFTAGFRPLWVGLGSIAAYTMLLVAGTGFLRRRMATSQRAAAAWRTIHLTSYGGWALAMLHGLRSGTDSGVPWVRWIYVACALSVVAAVGARMVTGSRPAIMRPTRQLAVTR